MPQPDGPAWSCPLCGASTTTTPMAREDYATLRSNITLIEPGLPPDPATNQGWIDWQSNGHPGGHRDAAIAWYAGYCEAWRGAEAALEHQPWCPFEYARLNAARKGEHAA